MTSNSKVEPGRRTGNKFDQDAGRNQLNWATSHKEVASQTASASDEEQAIELKAPNVPTCPLEPFKFAGYLATLLASILNSLSFFCVKLLPVASTVQEKAKASMIRGVSITFFCSLTILCQGHTFKVPRNELWLNLGQSLLGAIEMLLAYVALIYISTGECTALIYLSPVWTCLLSFLLLRERLQWGLLLALPLSLLGIVLLAQPSLLVDSSRAAGDNTTRLDDVDFRRRWPGTLAALAVSLLFSLITIIFKFRKLTPIVTCNFYLGLAIILVTSGVQLAIGFGSLPTSPIEWSVHFSIGLITYCTQCLFQWCLQFVPASTYSVVRTLDIANSFILSALFLSDRILWTSVAGASLIVFVVFVLVLNNKLVALATKLFSLIIPTKDTAKA